MIIDWLKTKENYVFYKKNTTDTKSIYEKFDNLLFAGRVHFQQLKACDFYIIRNEDDVVDNLLKHPNKHKYTFENFNIKQVESFFEVINLHEDLESISEEDTIQNRARIIGMLEKLQDSYRVLGLNMGCTYKSIFYDVNKNNLFEFVQSGFRRFIEGTFDFNEFKVNYSDRIMNKCRGLIEIGIFYPFKIDHDIFENSHYLFEINHLKFKKRTSQFFDLVANFYGYHGINSDLTKETFPLKQFFVHPGYQYRKQFAYFDPFKNYEKYKDSYKIIKANCTKNTMEFRSFIFELFELLNQAQIGFVKFQHENLIDAIMVSRSKNRTYSVRDLAKIEIKKLQDKALNAYGLYKFEYFVFQAIKLQPSQYVFNKNSKIVDIELLKDIPEPFKQRAQLILDDFLGVLNKDAFSNLKYIIDYYKNKILTLSKKYLLDKGSKQILLNMLVDLAIFYNEKDRKKLSKPFNSTFDGIYLKNQNKKLDDLIDFYFEESFIQKNQNHFEAYEPYKIVTDDGRMKYIMTY